MRTCALHLLADALLWLSATAAPVPPAKPLGASDLVGAWQYRWGGVPGVLCLSADGAYVALHGEARQRYAGVWWWDRGRVVVIEFATDCDGVQRGRPVRYEFRPRREGAAVILSATVDVALTRGGE